MHATTWMNLQNIMLNERNQIQKATYGMIPFIWNRIGKSIEREQTSSCQELEGGRTGSDNLINRYEVSFWGDENILELDPGDGWLHNTVNVLNASELNTLRWLMVDFILYEFFLEKKAKRSTVLSRLKIFLPELLSS